MLSLALLCFAAISLDAGELERDLAAMLRAELGDALYESAEASRVRVVLKSDENAYFIEVFAADSTTGERTLPRADGVDAALRLATLLASRAIDASRSLDDPLEIPPSPDELELYATAGFVTAWWQRPSTPTVGFGAGLGADFDTFTAGVFVFELGRACCERRSDRIVADAHELALLVEGSFSALRWGRVSLRARASGGMSYVRARARAQVPGQGDPAVRSVSAVEGVFRAGGSVDVELLERRAWFALGAGGWLRAGGVRIVNIDDQSLFSGSLVPYLEARISATIF